MKLVLSILSIVILIGFTSCNQNGKQTSDNNTTTAKVEKSSFENEGVIQKVFQTSSYTYCLLKTGSDTAWVAILKTDVKKGQTLYFNNGLEMKEFKSKELNRTFATLSLLQEASTDPSAGPQAGNPNHIQAAKPNIIKENLNIKPVNGSISIADVYSNKSKYKGQVIKVRGKVTKYNSDIMEKNWAHIQDGTKEGDYFDLTVTTTDQVKLGDIITFEGKIILDKDFGAGYFYPVIMMDAKVIK